MVDLIDIQAPLEQEGTKAVVRNWLREIGEKVKSGDPLVELETDKVTQEVAAPADGVLLEILMRNGDDARPAPFSAGSAASLPEAKMRRIIPPPCDGQRKNMASILRPSPAPAGMAVLRAATWTGRSRRGRRAEHRPSPGPTAGEGSPNPAGYRIAACAPQSPNICSTP